MVKYSTWGVLLDCPRTAIGLYLPFHKAEHKRPASQAVAPWAQALSPAQALALSLAQAPGLSLLTELAPARFPAPAQVPQTRQPALRRCPSPPNPRHRLLSSPWPGCTKVLYHHNNRSRRRCTRSRRGSRWRPRSGRSCCSRSRLRTKREEAVYRCCTNRGRVHGGGTSTVNTIWRCGVQYSPLG